jgi:arylformamidase
MTEHTAVPAAGKLVQFLLGESYNHCEIIETLWNPYDLLGPVVLVQMQLT